MSQGCITRFGFWAVTKAEVVRKYWCRLCGAFCIFWQGRGPSAVPKAVFCSRAWSGACLWLSRMSGSREKPSLCKFCLPHSSPSCISLRKLQSQSFKSVSAPIPNCWCLVLLFQMYRYFFLMCYSSPKGMWISGNSGLILVRGKLYRL